MKIILAIDYDGTLVGFDFPRIGKEIPEATYWLKEYEKLGVKIILWTMRSDEYLEAAVDDLHDKGLELWDANINREQFRWTNSPKVDADIYIDDKAFGCPLKYDEKISDRPFVDWDIVGPQVMETVKNGKRRKTASLNN